MATMPVDPLFAPPTEQWQRLSPRYLWVRIIATVIGWLVFFAIVLVPLALFTLGTDWAWTFWAGGAVAVAIFVWRLVRTPRWVRRWGYAERDDDVFITRGLLSREFVCVPYGRMQLVEVHAGPIDRMFGLATVRMVTASSSGAVSIPGLDRAAAEAVRDRFINRGEHLRAGI